MTTVVVLVLLIVALAIVVAFLQRFYQKASRERALIRTGAGGQKVVMDGGFLALPFLHRVEEVNMRTLRLEVRRAGEKSLMTEDRQRLDMELEFYLRVQPTPEGVATAAQAIGARALNPEDLQDLFEGRFIDAVQAVVATRTMDGLHEDRGGVVRAIAAQLAENLAQNGLHLESVSLTRLDQASFAALDENNAFNAVGMRRLAEVVASNRKKRAEIEADAEVSVRATQLASVKRKLDLEREQQQAQIAQTLEIERMRAQSGAETEAARQQAEEAAARARIAREREVKAAEIARDQSLRESEIRALLAAETAKIESQIALAERRRAELLAEAETEQQRRAVIEAQESVAAEKERLAAEREKATALIRVRQDAETAAERSRSEAETLAESAEAEARAAERRAAARLQEMQAEAQGKAALIEAENATSPALMRMKLDMHKMDRLPELAERLVKPLEKIDSIRINQVSGLGGAGLGGPGGAGSGGGAAGTPVSSAVDGVLNLALQLPAMQKLGRSIGLNLELGEEGEEASATKER